jgi:phenylpyruvate tautomerase
MPMLKINSSIQELDKSVIEDIHQEGAKALASELGKSIDYVMVVVNLGSSISFAQDGKLPSAYLEVKNIGELGAEVTQKLSGKLCEMVNRKLGVPQNRIYIEFQEAQRHKWGWDGKTFS